MPEKPVYGSLFGDEVEDPVVVKRTGDRKEPKTGRRTSELRSANVENVTDESGLPENDKGVIEMADNVTVKTADTGTADALDNFEETFDRLKAIVEELEREEIKLGEMVRLFEEGVGLIKKCDNYLKDARERVGKYIERGDDGKWIIKGLDAGE